MRTIFKNARVFTAVLPQSQPGHPTCMIVNDGFIEYVGADDDVLVKTAEAQGCTVQDVHGRTIAPGFIDG